MTPDRFIGVYSGTQIYAAGTYLNGTSKHARSTYWPPIMPCTTRIWRDVGWTPTLFLEIQPAQALPGLIPAQAGPFNW